MNSRSKLLSLAAGMVAALTAAAATAQIPGSSAGSAATVVVAGGLDWLEQSDVAAKQQGVLRNIEFNVGMRVKEGQELGSLDDAIAALTVKKQELVARSQGPTLKAKAQREQALSTLARLRRLNKGFVSQEEIDKAVADVNYADALLIEAQETSEINKAELDLASQTLEHHKIIAPFSGIVIERHKNPGEAVQPNDPVLKIGKTDKFRFVGWLSLENALKIRVDDPVQFRPTVDGAQLPIEQKVFSGRVVAISRELSTTGTHEPMVLAEIDNPPDPEHPELELFQGMQGELTIQLDPAASRVAGARPAAPAAPIIAGPR